MYQDQKYFNIVFIEYKKVVVYVQRQIARFLWPYWKFAHIYIDDIVIFFQILTNHFSYLKKIFLILKTKNILIKPTKVFLGYAKVQLFE